MASFQPDMMVSVEPTPLPSPAPWLTLERLQRHRRRRIVPCACHGALASARPSRRSLTSSLQRTFLKSEERPRNVPIQTIGLSLYEDLGPDISVGGTGLGQEEKIGKEVVRTQWLDKPILGRRILIVVSALGAWLTEGADSALLWLSRTRSTTRGRRWDTPSLSSGRTLPPSLRCCRQKSRQRFPKLPSQSSLVGPLPGSGRA